MATSSGVKSKIKGLIAKANSATGKNDTNLSSAVNNLIAGQGASDPNSPSPTETLKITSDNLALYNGKRISLAKYAYLEINISTYEDDWES